MSLRMMLMGGGGALDVAGEYDWHSLYCPALEQFQAEGYADSDQIDRIVDDSANGYDATDTPTSSAVFNASNGSLGGQPTITFSGGSADFDTIATFTDLTDEFSVVYVFRSAAITATHYILCDKGNSNRYLFGYDSSGRQLFRYGGGSTYTGSNNDYVANTNYGVVHHVTTSNNYVYVDGSLEHSVGTGGSDPEGWTIGSRRDGASEFHGELAFLGVYEGDIRSHAKWTLLQNWMLSTFGVSI